MSQEEKNIYRLLHNFQCHLDTKADPNTLTDALDCNTLWNMGKYSLTWGNNEKTNILLLKQAVDAYWQQQPSNEKNYTYTINENEKFTITTDKNRIILNDALCIRNGYFDYRTIYYSCDFSSAYKAAASMNTVQEFVASQKVENIECSNKKIKITLNNKKTLSVFRRDLNWFHCVNGYPLTVKSEPESIPVRFL